MAISQEAQNLYAIPEVRQIISQARNEADPRYITKRAKWGEHIEIRTEGKYPLVSREGDFDATLLRTIPISGETFRGGEFRVLANAAFVEHRPDNMSLHIIVDAIPLFLKELSDPVAQDDLSRARSIVANDRDPALLIQSKASDIHDGEYRNRPDGQLDIQEEIWYAKILTVMKMFPGLDVQAASRIVVKLGNAPHLADYGLGVATVAEKFEKGRLPKHTQIEVLDGRSLIHPFTHDSGRYKNSDLNRIFSTYRNEIHKTVAHVTAEHQQTYTLPDGEFTVWTLATYPIMQNGVEFQATLLATYEQGEQSIRTFRILEYGDRSQAYVRVDSICTNGVQAGDSHCDCRKQSEAEKLRAMSGTPMLLINIRDDEGRAHGEGYKGGTLAVQRAVNQYIVDQMVTGNAPEWMNPIGNGIAAQLFYYETGKPVDARRYGSTKAVLKYLGLTDIAHLVTDNQDKIAMIGEVATVHETTTAEVMDELTPEALATYGDKSSGRTGVPYTKYTRV